MPFGLLAKADNSNNDNNNSTFQEVACKVFGSNFTPPIAVLCPTVVDVCLDENKTEKFENLVAFMFEWPG